MRVTISRAIVVSTAIFIAGSTVAPPEIPFSQIRSTGFSSLIVSPLLANISETASLNASAFSISPSRKQRINYSTKSFVDKDYVFMQKKRSFHQLLKSRATYLTNLPLIGDDWISGGSKAPESHICQVATNFLHKFERYIFANKATPEIPKLVLGPIPSGGVGIELITSSNSLYINFVKRQYI